MPVGGETERGQSPQGTRAGCGESFLDGLLGYSTAKVVWVRDRRLGTLNLIFLTLIFTYIVLWQICYNTGYLKREVPVGTARLQLQRPTVNGCNPKSNDCLCDFKSIPSLPYCDAFIEGDTVPCFYWDEFDVVPASSAGIGEIFVTTRVRRQTQTRECPPDPRSEGLVNCDRVYWTNSTENFFVADIEDFTLLIAHSVSAPTLGIKENLEKSSGSLEVCNPPTSSKECKTVEPNKTDTKPPMDVFRVGDLLNFADVNLEQVISPSDGGTKRFEGLVLQVEIKYNNFQPWRGSSGDHFSFTYKVTELPASTYKTNFVSFSNSSLGGSTRVAEARHGIEIVVKQTGEIGAFNFQTLLTLLTTSLALLAFATFLVDKLAMYVMPVKGIFNQYKFLTTHDFRPFRRLLRRAANAGVSALELVHIADEIEEARMQGRPINEEEFVAQLERLISERERRMSEDAEREMQEAGERDGGYRGGDAAMLRVERGEAREVGRRSEPRRGTPGGRENGGVRTGNSIQLEASSSSASALRGSGGGGAAAALGAAATSSRSAAGSQRWRHPGDDGSLGVEGSPSTDAASMPLLRGGEHQGRPQGPPTRPPRAVERRPGSSKEKGEEDAEGAKTDHSDR